MPSSLPPSELPQRPEDVVLEVLEKRRRIPAWLMSFLFHACLFTFLALTLRYVPRGVAGVEPGRTVGIALAKESAGQRHYFDGDSTERQARQTQSENAPPTDASQALPETHELASNVSGFLPSADEGVGAGDIGSALPQPGSMTGGVGNANDRGAGLATTSVYGLPGTGTKFVYVFDRSASMAGYGGRPLLSAKNELIASLKDLQRTHQFQIIFYNQMPHPFIPAGGTPRLMWGDETSKAQARDFVAGVTADGATRHMDALKMALNLRPDVIFFLTDADEPQLSPDELADIRRSNHGTVINAIEFGFGPDRGDDNFLKRLARENDGAHIYVDISRLP